MTGVEIAMLAMAAVATVGTLAAGEQQAQAQEYNEKVAEQRGKMAMDSATAQAEIQARNNKRAMAEIVANYGAANLELSGSPLDVLWDQTKERKLAEEMLLYRGRQGEFVSAAEADGYAMAADGARTSSYFQAGTTALSAAYMSAQMPKPSATPTGAPANAGPTWGPYGKAGLRPY